MKYIANGFSPNMVNGNMTLKFEEVTKSDFLEASKNAYSIIGHPEIAEHFNLKLNRESITLKQNDVMFIVTPSQRQYQHKTVDNGHKYEFVTEEQGYTYRKITVL